MGFLFSVDVADVVFLSLATLVALVVILLSNPLTSWVNRMVGKSKRK
jgi:hypothetical protein